MAKKVNQISICEKINLANYKENQKVKNDIASVVIDLEKIAGDAHWQNENKDLVNLNFKKFKVALFGALETAKGILIKSNKKEKYFIIKKLNEATKLLTNYNYWEHPDSYVFALSIIKMISDYILITDLKNKYNIKIRSDQYLLYIKDLNISLEKQVNLMSMFIDYFTGGITCKINVIGMKNMQFAREFAKSHGINDVIINVINSESL